MESKSFKRIISKGKCNCSKAETILQCFFSLDFAYLPELMEQGYKYKKNYMDRGILFLEDENIIATGSVGSNRLKIICKANCSDGLDRLENVLGGIYGEKTK